MIEINKPYIVHAVDDTIPIDVIREASEFFPKDSKVYTLVESLSIAPYDGPWLRWEVDNGPYRGTLTTRLKAWAFKNWREEIDPDALAKFGTYVSARIKKSKEYVLEIGKPFWSKASFNDANSCWYVPGEPGYDMFRQLRMSRNGYAIKFYKDMLSYNLDHFSGIGRTWCYIDGEIMYTFNYRGNLNQIFPGLISEAIGLPHKPCNVQLRVGYTDGGGYAFGNGDLPTTYTIDYDKEDKS
jgi:hypothetical protein